MTEIRITIAAHGPNEERLRRAFDYEQAGKRAIDRRDREAYFAEADRIYAEEGRSR